MKNVVWKLQAFFNFRDSSNKKESGEDSVLLIWTNFDSFANAYLILVACFKNFVFQ